MKCPKCHYLGFETGDRCKNCGYDFSLIGSPAGEREVDAGRTPVSAVSPAASHSHALDRLSLADTVVDRLGDMPLRDGRDDESSPAHLREPRTAPSPESLPLFTGASLDDEPLVRFPAPPRPPLAVRRTPDLPRPRSSSTVVRRRAQPLEETPSLALMGGADRRSIPGPSMSERVTPRATPVSLEPCSPGARAGAALLDLAILLAIDLLVVYFTLRMAALAPAEWRLLPPVPLSLFLLLLNVAYAFAFTAIGGQTIGKMATRIRVVSEEGPVVPPASAFRRTLGAAVSILTLGSTFLPALVGRERRAVHDRIARTRVVALPVA